MKALFLQAASLSPLPRVFDRLVRINRLTVLMYHGVVVETPEVPDGCYLHVSEFARQMGYLARHFEVVPLREGWRRRGERASKPLAAVTFDDGLQSCHDVAFPLLERLDLPATVFLVTDIVGTGKTAWFCRLHRALTETGELDLDWAGCLFDLSEPIARARANRAISHRLKSLHPVMLESELVTIERRLGVQVNPIVAADSRYRILDPEAIRGMVATGLIDFGAHTATHAIVSRLTEDEKWHEIGSSLEATAGLTGKPCKLFAYPNGGPTDYDAASIEMLRKSGVEIAVTAYNGLITEATPVFEVPRAAVTPGMSDGDFCLLVHRFPAQLRAAMTWEKQ